MRLAHRVLIEISDVVCALPRRSHQARYAFVKRKAQMMMTLLGLRRCQDTIVGNDKMRGVS